MTYTVLASWKDGPAKQAIVDFVTSATTPGPGFVALADRIATFDNDGTLWVEQPLPPQFDFVFRRWGEEVQQEPSLAEQQPYKAIIAKDPAFCGRGDPGPGSGRGAPRGVRSYVEGHDTGRVRCAGARLA